MFRIKKVVNFVTSSPLSFCLNMLVNIPAWLKAGTRSHWHQWSQDFPLWLREAIDLLYFSFSSEIRLQGAICFALDFAHGTSAFPFSRWRSVPSWQEVWIFPWVCVCVWRCTKEMWFFLQSFVIISREDVYNCAIFMWGFVKDVMFWINISFLTSATKLQIVLPKDRAQQKPPMQGACGGHYAQVTEESGVGAKLVRFCLIHYISNSLKKIICGA